MLSSSPLARTTQGARGGGYFLRRAWRDRRDFILLVLPAALLFAAFMLYPLYYMAHVSTLDWRGLTRQSSFAGIENYVKLLADERFFIALKQTGIFAFTSLPVVFPLSFALGFFLSQRPPGYRILRVVFFTPAIMSLAAQSMMFVGIYMPDGIINTLLRAVGLDSLTRIWLGNTSTVLAAVIAIYYWGATGWLAVLFFASLSNLPEELFEAALMDGANYWTRMWRIAFPLTMDFFGVMLMLEFIGTIAGSAQTVLLLTNGGPGTHSLVLGYLLYEQAFTMHRLGYSQAIGVFVFVIGLAGMLLIRRATRRSYLA